jgi:hypothetical protein
MGGVVNLLPSILRVFQSSLWAGGVSWIYTFAIIDSQ